MSCVSQPEVYMKDILPQSYDASSIGFLATWGTDRRADRSSPVWEVCGYHYRGMCCIRCTLYIWVMSLLINVNVTRRDQTELESPVYKLFTWTLGFLFRHFAYSSYIYGSVTSTDFFFENPVDITLDRVIKQHLKFTEIFFLPSSEIDGCGTCGLKGMCYIT